MFKKSSCTCQTGRFTAITVKTRILRFLPEPFGDLLARVQSASEAELDDRSSQHERRIRFPGRTSKIRMLNSCRIFTAQTAA